MSTNNKLVTAPARERAISAALQEAGRVIAVAITNQIPTCLNCQWFDEGSEACRYAGANARPPARVIAFGCPAYEGIPF